MIGKLFFRTFFFCLFIIIALQVPLKGKSIMDHYLDETDNPYFQAVGNFVNGVKEKIPFLSKREVSPDLLKVLNRKKPGEKRAEIRVINPDVPADKNRRLMETRIPSQLATPILPENETYTAEEREGLDEILLSE